MKKTLMTVVMGTVMMIMLSGCTSSENIAMQQAGAGQTVTNGTTQVIQGNPSDNGQTTPAAGSGNVEISSDGATGSGDVELPSGGAADSGNTEIPSGGSSGSDTWIPTEQELAATATTPSADTCISPEDLSSQEAGTSASEGTQVSGGTNEVQENASGIAQKWNGVYSNETERVTLTYIESENIISFSFEQSGIYGRAELNEETNQAVYKGDDYHVVVFDLIENTVQVSVASEEDYDASESPLIGTYIKE